MASDPAPGRAAETKTRAASERDAQARKAWREAAAPLDPEQVVLVDESGTTSSRTRWSGWAPQDHRATRSVPRQHGKHTPVVAALAPDGLHEPWLIEGARDRATCVCYLTEPLAPTLRPGQGVLLDNLTVPKAHSSRQAIAARHCQLRFLPPSSPDCTPIEQAFSTIKAILRGLGARTKEALQEAVRLASEAITRHDAPAWFTHAGYALSAQAP